MKSKKIKAPLVYITIGIVWIVLSEKVVSANSSRAAGILNLGAGILFVFGTGFALYLLLEREKKKTAHMEKQYLDLCEQQIGRTGEILNKISNPVIISDAGGTISWINPAFTKVTGYTSFEIIGKNHINTLYCPKTENLVVTRLLDAVSRKEPFSADLLNYDKFNREYWVSLNLYPIFHPDGALECYVSVQNDITEHKEKEAVIGVQTEKLKAVSWLNSHQIRKPVASILALTQLMKSSDNEAEKEEILEMLHLCAIELDGIILEINAEASGRISA
jgi:PAS domain S-box-containing protein